MKLLNGLFFITASVISLNAFAVDRQAIQKCDTSENCLKLSEALYYEARGESKEGIIAVGQVVVNRSIRSSTDVVDVLEQKSFIKDKLVCQFSYICDIFYKKLPPKVADVHLNKFKVIAQGVLDNKFPDYAQGADHFLNESIKPPVWTKNMSQVALIGNHVFFDSTR